MGSELSAQERKRMLEALIESPGWAILRETYEEQERTRREQILFSPLAGADGVYLQEYVKGEMAALRLAGQLPVVLVEELKLVIAQKESEDGYSGDETGGSESEAEPG